MTIRRGVRIPVTTDATKAKESMAALDRQVEDLAGRAVHMGGAFQRGGVAVNTAISENERNMRRLGVTSDRVAASQRQKLIDSFEAIKRSGTASMAEIERAQTAMQAKLARIDQRVSLQQAPKAAAGMQTVTRAGRELDGQLRDTARAVAVLDGPLGGIASRFSSMASLVGGAGLATGAMLLGTTALTGAMGGLVEKARTFESTTAQTVQLLRTTGHASGQTAESLEQMAVALGEATLAGTQEAREAANILLTFKSVSGDAFERTLSLAQDLASIGMGGLTDSTKQLGKALEDPLTGLSALSKSGVSFSAQQKAVIRSMMETNRQAEAQTLILDILEGQIGGAATSAAVGLSGALDTLAERMGRFQEAAAQNSLPGLTSAVNGLSEAVQFGIENLDALTAAATLAAGVVAARFLGPVLAAATRTATGYASLTTAVAAGNAVLLNSATAAKAKAAAVQTAAAADNAAAQANLRAAQTERARVAATVAALEAEMRLEGQRLAAQINDTGRQARMRALIATRADLTRATTLLTQREQQLAAAQAAATAAATTATAATTAYAAAAARASIAARGLAVAGRMAAGALALVGGPMGLVILATGYLMLRTSEYEKAQRSSNDAVREAAELSSQLVSASDKQRTALIAQRAEIIRTQEAEIARIEALIAAMPGLESEFEKWLSDTWIGDGAELIARLYVDAVDGISKYIGDGEVFGGTYKELSAALEAAKEGLDKLKSDAVEAAEVVNEADAKTAAEAAKMRRELLKETAEGYRHEIRLAAMSAEERSKVVASDRAIKELREKTKELGEELTAQEERRIRALVETAETAKGAGAAVQAVLAGLRRSWQATAAVMDGGLEVQLGAISADEDTQSAQLEHLDDLAAKTEATARVAVEAEARKTAAVEAWARRSTAAAMEHYDQAIAMATRAGQDTTDLHRERLNALRDIHAQREQSLTATVDRLIEQEERHRDAAVEAARDAADRVADIGNGIRDLKIGLLSDEDQYKAREQDIRTKEAAARAALAAGQYDEAMRLAEEVARDAERNASRVPDTEAARRKAVEIATEHMQIAQELIAQAGVAMAAAENRAANLAGAEAQATQSRLTGVREQIALIQQAAVAMERIVLRVDTVEAERGLSAIQGRLVGVREEAEAAGRAMGKLASANPQGGTLPSASGNGLSPPEPTRAQDTHRAVGVSMEGVRAVVEGLTALSPGLAAARAELSTFADEASAGSAALKAGANAAGASLSDLAEQAARSASAQEAQARAATATERALTDLAASAAGASSAMRAISGAGPSTAAAPRPRWDRGG